MMGPDGVSALSPTFLTPPMIGLMRASGAGGALGEGAGAGRVWPPGRDWGIDEGPGRVEWRWMESGAWSGRMLVQEKVIWNRQEEFGSEWRIGRGGIGSGLDGIGFLCVWNLVRNWV